MMKTFPAPPRSRIRIASGFTVVLLAPLAPAAEEEPYIGPYIQDLRHDSVIIKWESEEPVEGEVLFGEGDALDRAAKEGKVRRIHGVELKGLRADTRYSYRVRWSGKEAPVREFRTMQPPGARRFRLGAYGDSRSNPVMHAQIAARMEAFEPDIVLHTGDLVTDGKKKEQWKPQFFDPIRKLAASTPFITCLGNHEHDSGLYYDYFDYPGNEAWHSYRWAHVHFIVLDTQKPTGPGSAQLAWLEKELAGPDADWRIVFFHSPMYSCHPAREVEDHRRDWQDVFERGGVDLVLSGHDHFYHRTHRVGRAWGDGRGVYHITTAGGGAPLYPVEMKCYTAVARSIHHFLIIDFDGTKATGRALSASGEVIDEFSIECGREEISPLVSYEMLLWEHALAEAVKAIPPEPPGGAGPGAAAHPGRPPDRIEKRFRLPPFPLGAAEVSWRWAGGSSAWGPVKPLDVATTAKDPFEVMLVGDASGMYPLPELELTLSRPPGGGREFVNRVIRIEPLRFQQRGITSPRIRGPMKCDGGLDEPAWRDALVLGGFTRQKGRRLSGEETVWIAHDEDAIHIAARVEGLLPRRMDVGSVKRDERRIIRHDESWTFSFTAQGAYPLSFVLGGNTRGTLYDSLSGVTEWNPRWEFVPAPLSGGWQAEVRIPWKALGLQGPPPGLLRANFQRRDGSDESLVEWSSTFSALGTERRYDPEIRFEPAAEG